MQNDDFFTDAIDEGVPSDDHRREYVLSPEDTDPEAGPVEPEDDDDAGADDDEFSGEDDEGHDDPVL